MDRTALIGLIGIAAIGLGGCDGVVVNRSEIAGGYTGYLYAQTQAAGGVNGLVVRNSPFPPEAVLAALQARYQSNQYRFALGPSPEWNGYTVIIAFGGAPVGGQNLCQNPALPSGPVLSDTTSVIADYCYGTTLVSEATGWTSAVSSPNDARFQRLVGDVVAELFSYRVRPGNHGQASVPN